MSATNPISGAERPGAAATRSYELWLRTVRGATSGFPESTQEEIARALVAADERGDPSCVWHEVTAWMRRQPTTTCALCGGRGPLAHVGMGNGPFKHSICEARLERLGPGALVRVDWDTTCPCNRPECRAARGEKG